MNDEALCVLLVDDEASLRKPLARHLSNMYGYHVDTAANEEEAWERVLRAERPYNVALVDDLLTPKPGAEPEPIGIRLMARIRERSPETECIIFTGWGMDRALEALQAGAYRYLAKPLNLDELGMTIRMAAEQARLRWERDLLSATLEISGAMLSELDVGKTLEVITEAVPKLVGAEACAVARVDLATGQMLHEPMIPMGDAAVRWRRHLKGVSLTRQIIETGREFFLPDVDARADEVDENLRRAGVKSFIGLPIPDEPENWGVLYAYSSRQEAFGTHERHVLQLLAGQAAIALKNARLFADTQKSAQCSEALYRTGHALSSYLEEEPVIRAILEAVYRTLGCEHVLISTVDDEAETIGIRHGIWNGKLDVFPEWIEMSQYSLDHPDILTDIYRTGRTEIIKGWDDRFNREIYDEFGHERFLRIFMPIKTRDEVIGVVEVGYDKREKGHISEDEVQLLAAFMDQAAVTLENARLFSQLSETKEQLDVLIESSFDAVIAIDQDKRITIFNRRAEEMFGWEAEEMLGQSVARLHMDVETAKRIFDVVNQGEPVAGWNVDLKHRDGIRIPALLSATLIRDSQGRPIGQGGFMRVRLAEDRLRALIRVSQAITGVLELDEVLDLIVKSAVAVFPAAQGGAIHLYDKRAGTLRIPAITRDYSAEALKALSLRVGEGIAGWVFQNQQPLVVEDTRQDPRYKRIDHPEIQVHRSMICVPLRVRERVIGTLSLNNSDTTGAFQSEDLGLLASFADQAAIAIENARLYEREHYRAHEAEAMVQVGQAISSTLDLDKIMEIVAQNALLLLGLENGQSTIVLIDERTGDFVRLTRVPPRKDGNGPRRSGGLTSLVIETGEPIVISDVRRDSRVRASVVEEGVRSLIGVPLKVKDRTIGVLFANTFCPRDFTQHDIEMLSSLANQAAVAIMNAELMENSIERSTKLEMLSQASNEMMSNLHSLGLDDRLNLIVRHAAQILDAEAGSIFLVRRAGFLTKEACYGHLESDFQRGREFAIRSGRKMGLTGHIAYTGELFNAYGDDLVGHWAVAGKEPAHVASGKCHSLLAIPLKRRVDSGEQLVGLLEVENKKDKDSQPKSNIGFTEEDEWILSIFAETMVICLENAELYERTSDRLEEKVVSLRAIQETGAGISAELDLDELLELITEKAATVFAAPAASLMLWDNRKENLVVKAKYGLTDEYTQQRIPRERVDAAIARMGGLRPLATVDLRSTPYGRLDLIKAGHIVSVLSTPLVVSDRLIGILNIYSKDEPRQFTSDEIEVAEVFAHQAAVSIRNAQLYEETTRRANALKALYEAGKKVTGTLALDEILNHIAEQAWKLTGRYGKPVLFSHLALVEENKLKFIAAHPPKHLPGLRRGVGDIDLEHDECIGVTGRAAKTGQPQLVGDVTQDSDYIEYDPETRSELAVPIKVGEQIIGIINVEHSEHDAFDEMDRRALEALAGQAAIAIQNARSYQAEQQRVKELAGLDSISQSIRSLTSIHEVYQQVNESIAQLVGAQMCAVLLHSEVEEALVCQLPMYGVPDEFGRRYRIPVNQGSPVGFLWETRDSLIINGVEQHPLVAELGLKELAKEAGLRDTVLIKLTVGNRNIGVIQASNKCDGKSFDENDARLLCIFATQAAAVIENARLYEELKQMYEELKHTKGLIGARTALAWMGMVSSEWRHRIRNQAQTIQEQIQHLRKDLRQAPKHDHHIAIDDRLSMIERLTMQIQERPIVPPLSAEEGVTLFALNDLIGERAKQLWKNDPYGRAELRLNLRLSNTATVKASPEWLRRAFDILVDNAVEAVAGCERRQITVTTRPANEGAEIAVSDTGGGIPPEVMSWLFERQVHRPERAEGFGIGLLIAQAIVQTYGGDIWVESTGPTGTTMVVWLPLVAGNRAGGSIHVV